MILFSKKQNYPNWLDMYSQFEKYEYEYEKVNTSLLTIK